MRSSLTFLDQIKRRSELLRQVVSWSQTNLEQQPNSSLAKIYLQSRMTPRAIAKYHIGLWDPSKFSRTQKETLKELKFWMEISWQDPGNNSSEFGYFDQHPLMLPLQDEYGNFLAILGREIPGLKEKAPAKYRYSKYHKQQSLFGLLQAKQAILASKKTFLVEGQFDAITCHSHGFHNVVALGGTNLSWYQAYLLKKYDAQSLVLLLDNDDSGKMAQGKIIQNYGSDFQIQTPKINELFKDIDECLRSGMGSEIFLN